MSVEASVAETRATVTIRQAPAPGLTMTLYRDTAFGRVPVPGVQSITATTMVVTDHAVPLNRPVTYGVALSDGQVFTAAPVTLVSELCLLTNPVSGAVADVWIATWPDRTFDTPSTVVKVPGRRSPIIIQDIEGAAASNPELLTRTRDQRLSVENLTATGELLLIRTVSVDVPDAYLAITNRAEKRLSNSSRSTSRLHALTVQEVGAESVTELGLGSTLGDLAAVVPGTLAALAQMFPGGTLLDIAATDWQSL